MGDKVKNEHGEILYIWTDLPMYGYGVQGTLLIKADNANDAFEQAVATLENEMKACNYQLPAHYKNIETMLMMAEPPDAYYIKYFRGKLVLHYD